MLSVEERHALLNQFDNAIHTARTLGNARGSTDGSQIDHILTSAARAEIAQREFYETLNMLTRWHEHPAVAEPEVQQ